MAITANGYALGGAFQEFIVSGLSPAAGVVGVQSCRSQQKQRRCAAEALQGLGHFVGHRICKFREIRPDTGPPSGTMDSLASDSRRTWTVPGAGRPSIMLICDNGTLGNSLSSQT